ncbi:MAG: serine hydrolase [Actinomycetota bacterium]
MRPRVKTLALHELQKHIADNLPMVRGLLVSRNGQIMYECYYEDGSPEKRTNIWSCTKSFTSVLVGMLVKQNNFPKLHERIADLLPSLTTQAHESFKKITVGQCMNMSIGYKTDIGDHDVLRAIMKPVDYEPGSEFFYNDIGSHIISRLISETTGSTTSSFANSVLFAPLGINDPHWNMADDGYNIGGHGLQLSPREMLTFGQFVLQSGEWQGVKFVDEEFFAQTIKKQTDGGFPGENPYGYLWWVSDRSGYHSYYALGYGGQLICVCPELHLVTVLTCTDELGADIAPAQDLYFDYIMPACQ